MKTAAKPNANPPTPTRKDPSVSNSKAVVSRAKPPREPKDVFKRPLPPKTKHVGFPTGKLQRKAMSLEKLTRYLHRFTHKLFISESYSLIIPFFFFRFCIALFQPCEAVEQKPGQPWVYGHEAAAVPVSVGFEPDQGREDERQRKPELELEPKDERGQLTGQAGPEDQRNRPSRSQQCF